MAIDENVFVKHRPDGGRHGILLTAAMLFLS
jgi:hypothetical protein